MRRLPLLLALLFSLSGLLHAQTKPERMHGLLWEISGHGIKKKGYLYGTMHISEKLAFNLSDTFFIALRQVDMVALETNHFEWPDFTNRMRLSRGGDDGNYSYNAYNTPNLYNDAFKFTTPGNEMLGGILAFKPRMSNEFLYRTNEGRQDYEEDTYLDQFIFQSGHKLGKTVIGLESLEGSYEAVTRAQLPNDDDTEENERIYLDPNKLEEAYRSQDLTMLDSLHKSANPGKTFQRWMLTERNIIMANRIDSILQSGTALFSAVGAAHLPGDMGVITLLRQKGYTMRPVFFTNVMGNKDKEEIDLMRYPVTFARQWARDSSWTVDAPGKFYPTTKQRGFSQELYADMGNGSYYAVTELNTYGWWTGQSPAYLAERLDSLVYEQVPGRIMERKRLTTPYPGHEITTRTKRGDVMRYKIFFTPLKMYVFMTSGSGDYALGEQASQFLNSIQFKNQTAAILEQPHTVKHPDYTITFPADLLENATFDPKSTQFLAASATSDGSVYFLYRTAFHDLDFIEEDTFELNIIGERIAGQFTKKSPQTNLVATSPYPTQDFSFRADRDSSYLFGRIVIDGPRYYLLGCRKNSPGAPTAFFESFSLDKTTRLATHEKIETDTSMHFRAIYQTALADEKPDAFFEKLDQMREEAFKKQKKSPNYRPSYYDGEDETAEKEQTTLYDPYTGEKVTINVSTMAATEELPALDSLQRRIVQEVSESGNRPVRSVKWDTQNNVLTGDLVVEDTNSTRGIRSKYVVINRKIYTLGAVINLNAPESPFVQSIFNTFTSTDTVTGESLTKARDLAFLQDIYATDSTKRQAALQKLEKMPASTYRPEHFTAIQTAIQHPDFGKLKFGVRSDLLCAMGATKTPAAAEFTRNFYGLYPDSARYQLAALYTLAQMGTKPAFDALFDLWLDHPVDLESYENNLFTRLNDTLKLTAHYTKQLVKLAAITEYQNGVLDLLDKLRIEKLIKPSDIIALKPLLIAQSNWQISKNQYQNEEKRAREDSGERYYGGYQQQSISQTLTRNFNFLAPYLRKDKAVRALIENAIKYGDQKLQLAAYGIYLENGIGVAPDKIKSFSEDDETRLQLFQTLAATGTLNNYPKAWFADTLAMMRSYLLFDNVNENSSQKLDSIRLLSRHATTLNGKPATIYFFDLKYKKNKKWGLGDVKAIPDFSYLLYGDAYEKLTGKNYYKSRAYRYKATSNIVSEIEVKEKEELIRKKIGSIRFDRRERYEEEDDRRRRYYGN